MSLQVTNNPPISSFDIRNFQNTLTCPVTLEPFTDDAPAVMLIPCGHTISKVAANHMYCGMVSKEDTERVNKPGPCPLCRRVVKAYYTNLIVQSIANQALNIKSEDVLLAVFAIVKADEKKDLDSIPFPGKGAHFVHISGNWNFFNSGSLVRSLKFLTATPGSLFEAMSVLGYEDGSVALGIEYEKAAISYLEACGIILGDNFKMIKCYISNNNDDTKLLFNIIAKHNKIPEDKFPLIHALVASGDWRTVTPLKPEELLPVRNGHRYYKV